MTRRGSEAGDGGRKDNLARPDGAEPWSAMASPDSILPYVGYPEPKVKLIWVLEYDEMTRP